MTSKRKRGSDRGSDDGGAYVPRKAQHHVTHDETAKRVTRGMTTAAARLAVLETSELLEHILFQLPTTSICVSQRTCRLFQDVITDSTKIQKKLLLKAPDKYRTLVLKAGKLCLDWISDKETTSIIAAATRLHPLIQADGELSWLDLEGVNLRTCLERGYSVLELNERGRVMLSNLLNAGPSASEPSFMGMRLFDGPTTKLEVTVWWRVEGHEGSVSVMSTTRPSPKTGSGTHADTFGDLFDAIAERSTHHIQYQRAGRPRHLEQSHGYSLQQLIEYYVKETDGIMRVTMCELELEGVIVLPDPMCTELEGMVTTETHSKA